MEWSWGEDVVDAVGVAACFAVFSFEWSREVLPLERPLDSERPEEGVTGASVLVGLTTALFLAEKSGHAVSFGQNGIHAGLKSMVPQSWGRQKKFSPVAETVKGRCPGLTPMGMMNRAVGL